MNEASSGSGAKTSDPEEWVDLHGDCLYRYALLRVRDPELAQDMVQETLLAALRARDRFSGKSSERTWIQAICGGKALIRSKRSISLVAQARSTTSMRRIHRLTRST